MSLKESSQAKWSPDSWRKLPVVQQPNYKSKELLEIAQDKRTFRFSFSRRVTLNCVTLNRVFILFEGELPHHFFFVPLSLCVYVVSKVYTSIM